LKTWGDEHRRHRACALGLGGGELRVADERRPDEWEGRPGITYSFEGLPHAIGPGELGLDVGGEVMTAILECLFGEAEAGVDRWLRSGRLGRPSAGGAPTEHARAPTMGTSGSTASSARGGSVVYLGKGWCEVVGGRAVGRTRRAFEPLIG